ncbi:MAG: aldo/keto reductase [Capsulimonadales bacterium]|nr:aldo/keto reductase [Capsulimonadales bacterium]
METRRLGTSDFNISVLGFGAWAIGGSGWRFAWGHQDDKDSIAAIHEALEAGINWIDTAAVYGLGHSEEVVARALSEWKGTRPYVFTKCERAWNDRREITPNLKADSIRRECENSLRRLKTDAIDLYQIHWPQPDEDIEEGWATLAALRQEGKVRFIGVSNFSVAQMKRAGAIAPITSLQPPYSLIERGIETEILPYCREHAIGVIVYSPMESGLLTGTMTRERIAALPDDDWRRNNRDFKEPNLTRNLELVELLKAIGERHGRNAGEVAIAWTLRHPAVTGAIVGLRRPGQTAGVIGAVGFRLSDAETDMIERFLHDHPLPSGT